MGTKSYIICACGCGESLEKYNYWGYERKYILGHNVKKSDYFQRLKLFKSNEVILCKCGCGETTKKYDNRMRERKGYIRGHSLKVFHPLQVWNKDKKNCYSAATLLKMSQSLSGVKNPNFGKPKSFQTRLKQSLANSLENHWNWQGGKSFEPYPLGWNKTYKEQIRYRDAYKCQICGKPEIENIRKLDVHHIDYNKQNLNINNLISLCRSCHMKTNFNKNNWLTIFSIKNNHEDRNAKQ